MEEMFLASCAEGVINVCSKLIKKAVNVNCTDSNGQTGIIKACSNGHYGIVRMLLRNKADVNIKDINGQNALYFAIKYSIKANNAKIVKLLCNYDIDAKQNGLLKPRDLTLTTTTYRSTSDIENILYNILNNYEMNGIIPSIVSDYDTEDEQQMQKKDVIMFEKKKKNKKKRKNKKGGASTMAKPK